MHISEISQLLSLSMSYQAYLQELNARNLQLAGTGSSLGVEKSFAELVDGLELTEMTADAWRARLVDATAAQPGDQELDQISIATSKSAGSYRAMAEGLGRVFDVYRTSLGKG